jgi:uncharacterized ion transporter superfamily protein YfcC
MSSRLKGAAEGVEQVRKQREIREAAEQAIAEQKKKNSFGFWNWAILIIACICFPVLIPILITLFLITKIAAMFFVASLIKSECPDEMREMMKEIIRLKNEKA